VPEDGSRRELRRGFNADAEAYDRTRPVLPGALFDDLLQAAGLRQGDRVVEIGCGTGQATVPLAERGLAVTAVELGAALADRARARTAGFPLVRVVTSSFEDWRDTSAVPVRAVAVFNALHWIDPGARYAKPAAILARGGVMAVGSCRWARPADAEPFWFDVQQDYRAMGVAGEPPPPPEQIGKWHFPDEARAYFDEVASFRYPLRGPTRLRTTSRSCPPSPGPAQWGPRAPASSSPGYGTGSTRRDHRTSPPPSSASWRSPFGTRPARSQGRPDRDDIRRGGPSHPL
jgi:SAM-dependent methyltransferase